MNVLGRTPFPSSQLLEEYGGNFLVIVFFTVSFIIKAKQQMIVKKLKYAAKK